MITPAEQDLFSHDFVLGLQQKGTKLRSCCQTKFFTEGRKAEMFKELGATEAEDDDAANNDTPVMSTPMTNRWVHPRKFHWGDLFDEKDIKSSIGDPTSPIIQNGILAMGRRLDRGRIIPALFGSSAIGDDGEKTVEFPADGSQDIAVSVGATTAGSATSMNVDKFIDAYTLLLGNEVDLETENITIAMSSLELRGLMKDPKFVSDEYREQRVYDNIGNLSAFMGVKILTINALPSNAAGTLRYCPMWCASAVGLGIWIDQGVKMGVDPGKQFKMRVYSEMYAGAARLNEKKIVRIANTYDGARA